jgi:hypothetical protein
MNFNGGGEPAYRNSETDILELSYIFFSACLDRIENDF